jgi:hypothetical protein
MTYPINILIARLKQAPRLGATNPPKKTTFVDNDTSDKANLKADVKEINEGIDDLVKNLGKYSEVVNKLNTENLSLQKGISVLTKDFEDYAVAMVDVVKGATYLEQRNAGLNKNLGITSKTAAKLGEAFDVMGEGIGVAGSQLRVYAQELNKTLPGMSGLIAGTNKAKMFNEKFSKSLLGATNLLREHTGLTEEQTQKYLLYAASQGKSALETMSATQKWAEEFESATGMTGVYTMALEEISNLSEDVAMTYRKYPGMLEKSVVKAKLLGTSFEKIENMATNMLNIEQSVGQELEYQLLSGKRLVNQQGESITENLRIAKLSGNSADQVKAMNDLLTTQGDVLDGNNHYAKEQLAQLTGYTVQEMARMRQTRAMLKEAKMSDEDINGILSLEGDAYQKKMAELAKTDPKVAGLITELKETTSKQTTDQLLGEILTLQRDKGIRVMLGGKSQEDLITGARTDVIGQGTTFGTGGAIPEMTSWGQQFQKPEIAKMIGILQTEGELLTATKGPLNAFIDKLPLGNAALGKFNTTLQTLIDTAYGTGKKASNDASTPGGVITGTTPTGTTVPDGIVVNDGLIKFHPADKFAAIPQGAALLASTSTGALEGSVDKLMGNKSNVAVVDPGPIAAAIMSALASMKVNVNYDVGKAAEAATFKLNQGING